MSEAATDLVLRTDQKFFDQKQVAALRAMGVAQDTSNADLAVFFHQARRTGLDPFAKQIYLMQRRSKDQRTGEWETKSTIQTGIDGYRLIARKAATKMGTDYDYGQVEWCDSEGKWSDVWLRPGEAPIAARVTLYVGEKNKQYPAIAHYSEYVQLTKSGEPNSMWTKMAASQLAKCAEALALRKAFPLDLSGIYTEDEMQQADEALADLGETSGAPAPAAADAPKTPVQRKRRATAKAPEPTTPMPEAHAPTPEPEDLGEQEVEPAVDADGVLEDEPQNDPAAPDPADPSEPPAEYGADDDGPAAVLEADTEPEAASTTPTEEALPSRAAFKQCTPGQFRTMSELATQAFPDRAELRMFLGEWFRKARGLDKLVALPSPQETSREEAETLTAHLKSLIAGELPGV